MAEREKFRRRLRFALEYPDAYLAQQDSPGAPRPDVPFRLRGLLPPGEGMKGYGGSAQWPFDFYSALTEEGYRRGITRASVNPAFNSVWRHYAKEWLKDVEVQLSIWAYISDNDQ